MGHYSTVVRLLLRKTYDVEKDREAAVGGSSSVCFHASVLFVVDIQYLAFLNAGVSLCFYIMLSSVFLVFAFLEQNYYCTVSHQHINQPQTQKA